MQSLEDLKRRISTTLFITGDEVQRVRWPDNTPPPEHEALKNTTICLIVMDDGISHTGSAQTIVDESNEVGKQEAFEDAVGNAYDYYEAMTSYPDTISEPLNLWSGAVASGPDYPPVDLETQDGCPND